MKKIIITMTLLIVVTSNIYSKENIAITNNINTDFATDGLSGIKWDDSINKHKQTLTLFQKGKNIKIYKHKDESYQLVIQN